MVDKYDFTIYPRRLWVCTDIKEANKRLRYADNKKELDDMYEKGVAATYYPIEEKSSKDLGYAVVLYSDLKGLKGSEIINVISHEATHVATKLCADSGIDIDAYKDEPFAYLVGFISSCIWKTASKIIYKDKNGTDKD